MLNNRPNSGGDKLPPDDKLGDVPPGTGDRIPQGRSSDQLANEILKRGGQ